MSRELSVIVITGASSGLGKALALIYSAPGRTLHIFGRNPQGLADTADRIQQLGGIAVQHIIDVINGTAMEEALTSIDQTTPIDLLIANAGTSAGTGGGNETAEQTRMIFDTNVTGVLNSILPILPTMRKRKHGQIAIMSSIASFRGMPSAPAYSASKAAVRTWGEGLRGDAAQDNVMINVICPGFIKTPMTDVNTFKMPFLLSPEHAAFIIQRKLESNTGRITFPLPMAFAGWLLHALPDKIIDIICRQLPKKP